LLGLPQLDAAWVNAGLRWLGAAVALSGLLGVGCSVMLYAVTRRAFWKLSQSGPRFFATTAVLGTSITLLVFTAAARAGEPVPGYIAAGLNGALIAFSVFKLLHELSIFSHLRLSQASDLKRTARLMRGELAPLAQLRFLFGVLGGIALPFWLSVFIEPKASALALGTLPVVITAIGAACLTAGEFIERSLFFMAAASPKMPGAVGK
jgi:formate dehydrogenase iron-sulfur subunit